MNGVAILKPLFLTEVPAVESFVAKDKFRERETICGVRAGIIWGSLSELTAPKTIPIALSAEKLQVCELMKHATTTTIVSAVHNGAFADHTEACGIMWRMLQKQGSGKEGKLLTNGVANIFPHLGGIVFCKWVRVYTGWDMNDNFITLPLSWFSGCRIIFRRFEHF